MAQGGLLQGLRDDVRGSKVDSEEAEEEEAKKDRHHHYYSDHDDTIQTAFGHAIGQICFYTVTAPLWMPRSIVDDDSFQSGYFARYPYRCDLDGYMAPDASTVYQSLPWMVGDRYSWLLRTRVEYADDLNDMSRIGGQLLLDTASRWGIDTEANYRREELDWDDHDQLWTGDCNVVFRFAQSPKLQMRTGLGFNWLSDHIGSDFGINFTYGGDWFPLNPWVVSAEIDWGTLGKAGLFHGRTTVGVHFHRLEVYTGYDYFDVGGAQISGLIGGMRLWY